jgi:hypothetical protein
VQDKLHNPFFPSEKKTAKIHQSLQRNNYKLHHITHSETRIRICMHLLYSINSIRELLVNNVQNFMEHILGHIGAHVAPHALTIISAVTAPIGGPLVVVGAIAAVAVVAAVLDDSNDDNNDKDKKN